MSFLKRLAFLLALGGLPTVLAAAPAKEVLRVRMAEGTAAVMTVDQELFYEGSPRPGEGLYAFTRRLCGSEELAGQVAAANDNSRDLLVSLRYRVPFPLLSPEMQLQIAKALFPDDKPQADGWRHRVNGVGPLRREGLWHLARWFTGQGENFRALREYNELEDDEVSAGSDVVIPSELLLPAFRNTLPPAVPVPLEYGKDRLGEYAVYRLRPGEALYSGVVVRFTDRVFGADVNALAAEIAKRNGIADVTDIHIGYRVKIPLDVLRPEFLPEGNPRRLEYEASLRASNQFSNPVRAQGLDGITVVLDAGHGGKDSGATYQGVWESLYVYDVTMRVKQLLETRTLAKVIATTRDGADFRIHDADVLPFSRAHSVLTTPPYAIEDAKVGVNLRWYLANSVYRKASEKGADGDKMVFLSIHADSLHPSIRGAMAYIPAANMRKESYGKSSAVYTSRKEVQESPQVSFPQALRVKSEGLSRELAENLIDAFGDLNLAVHPFKPVREKIIREGSEWVPAVLRYNSVPSKVLLEICNLANEQDRRLLQTRTYRQKIAEAIVRGILTYYDQDPATVPSLIAASAK